MIFTRRNFLKSTIAMPVLLSKAREGKVIIHTVKGEIAAEELGITLVHEHVLVDFIGADKISASRWNRDEVIQKVLPFLLELKSRGVKSILECTPAYLGRDVVLLRKLSDLTGLNIVTNTGYYGALDNKYLPSFAFQETAAELALRWIGEFRNGIDDTDIRPGFIKIGVGPGPLSDLHKKLVKAAALTHLETGLTICSHTGPALPAAQQLSVIRETGVHASAFVWVHASGDNDDMIRIARTGAWVSLDGISRDSLEKNLSILQLLKSEKLLDRALISHDGGWYRPGEPEGGVFRGYTTISDRFIPLLKATRFTSLEIEQLMVTNPERAFSTRIRKI
jgi:phosphotriesterase-related protein